MILDARVQVTPAPPAMKGEAQNRVISEFYCGRGASAPFSTLGGGMKAAIIAINPHWFL